MTKLVYLSIAGLVLAVTACNFMPDGRTSKPIEEPSTKGVPIKEDIHQRDIGDAEAALKIEATLAQQSQAPGIKMDTLVNMRDELDMATITVTPPAPPELFVSFVIKARNLAQGAPVVVRAKIMRDKEEIDSFNTIIENGAGVVFEYPVNAMKGLTSPPETMLLSAVGDIFLLARGTDVKTVDPATVTVPESEHGSLLSNPVRINFTSQAAQQ